MVAARGAARVGDALRARVLLEQAAQIPAGPVVTYACGCTCTVRQGGDIPPSCFFHGTLREDYEEPRAPRSRWQRFKDWMHLVFHGRETTERTERE